MNTAVRQLEGAESAKTASIFVFAEGILLVLFGLAALCFPAFAGIATAVLFGWILMASGIAGLLATFSAKNHVQFWWSLLSSILAIVAGLIVAFHPFTGALVLVVVIAAWLALDGVSSLMIALDLRRTQRRAWGWLVGSAVFDWLLALFLLFLSPVASLFMVGLIIGIDLVFGGLVLLTIAAAVRRSTS
jgi:uncharacterized membrane protein HdeD (DUF308 family)